MVHWEAKQCPIEHLVVVYTETVILLFKYLDLKQSPCNTRRQRGKYVDKSNNKKEQRGKKSRWSTGEKTTFCLRHAPTHRPAKVNLDQSEPLKARHGVAARDLPINGFLSYLAYDMSVW